VRDVSVQLSLSHAQGNPCVEEPDYRLTMVTRLPQLAVLDQHVVTASERRKAAAVVAACGTGQVGRAMQEVASGHGELAAALLCVFVLTQQVKRWCCEPAPGRQQLIAGQ
jgi:hypothetical protein